jgi:hypothetical protein
MELMENGNFRLFSANGKTKTANFHFFAATEAENKSFLSLVGKR